MNKFALLAEEFEQPTAKKVAPKAAAAPKVAAEKKAAPKAAADKKVEKPQGEKKGPINKDRHTKGGRDAGAEAPRKKFHDRSLPRNDKRQTERKGADRSNVKGGTAAKDPEADQVAADVDQKKEEAEEKKEEVVEEKKAEEVKPEEPKPFLLADALKARQGVAGETKKVAKAKNPATSEAINQGQKQTNTVIFTKPQAKKINANKKTFNIDEFTAITAGSTQKVEQQYKKQSKPKAADFPTL